MSPVARAAGRLPQVECEQRKRIQQLSVVKPNVHDPKSSQVVAPLVWQTFEPRLTVRGYPGPCLTSSTGSLPPDRLRLLAFDAELRRLPRPFLDALWAGVDALESSSGSSGEGMSGVNPSQTPGSSPT